MPNKELEGLPVIDAAESETIAVAVSADVEGVDQDQEPERASRNSRG